MGLRYAEFVSLNTWQIQKLKARTAELEVKVTELETKLNELTQQTD
jgi:cytochrome oxidase assembly protein ShyY1